MKNNNKFLISLISISVLLPFAINWIFGFIVPFLPGTMYVGTNETWINFIGTFIGGSLTLIGVNWQLNQTNKKQNEDLINNTSAVYGMLEIEIEKIKEHLNCNKESFEKIKTVTLKRNFEDFSEKSGIENDVSQYFELVLPTFPKETIFNFIDNSLPKQKMILINLTNYFYYIGESIQKNDCITNLDKRLLSCEEHLQHIEELMKKFELEKLKFEKLK